MVRVRRLRASHVSTYNHRASSFEVLSAKWNTRNNQAGITWANVQWCTCLDPGGWSRPVATTAGDVLNQVEIETGGTVLMFEPQESEIVEIVLCQLLYVVQAESRLTLQDALKRVPIRYTAREVQ
jgi:hypothetical protein